MITIDEIYKIASRVYPNPERFQECPKESEIFGLITQMGFNDEQDLNLENPFIFQGYGVCVEYENDPTEKQRGKWIYLKYITLKFPPQLSFLRIQSHQLLLGRFPSPDHKYTTFIRTLNQLTKIITTVPAAPILNEEKSPEIKEDPANNCISFPIKKP